MKNEPIQLGDEAAPSEHRSLKGEILKVSFQPVELCLAQMGIPDMESAPFREYAGNNLMAGRLMNREYNPRTVALATMAYLEPYLRLRGIEPNHTGLYCYTPEPGQTWLVIPSSLIEPLRANIRSEKRGAGHTSMDLH